MGLYNEALLEYSGHTTTGEMLEEVALESIVPGVCKNEDCLLVTEVEPDQGAGWCPECEAKTVVSCLRLWGFI